MRDNRLWNQGAGRCSDSPSHGVGAEDVRWCPRLPLGLVASVFLPPSLSPLLSLSPTPPKGRVTVFVSIRLGRARCRGSRLPAGPACSASAKP